MDFNINTWMKGYLDGLKALFAFHLQFVGLQGSYGRGEATADSDIDAVVILDQVTLGDLKAYGTMLDTLRAGRRCRNNQNGKLVYTRSN